MNGVSWTTNPPTYTCQEACALLFGGLASQYQCSSTSAGIDRQGWTDGWGLPCQVFAETYKLSTFYNCGSTGCAISAYVMDHSCSNTNYCYR
jgi:hypothetical protein